MFSVQYTSQFDDFCLNEHIYVSSFHICTHIKSLEFIVIILNVFLLKEHQNLSKFALACTCLHSPVNPKEKGPFTAERHRTVTITEILWLSPLIDLALYVAHSNVTRILITFLNRPKNRPPADPRERP